ERARLLAVELDLYLGIRRIERGEDGGELWTLARRRQEGACVDAELIHAQGPAAVLEQEVEASRRAEAGDGRDVERKRDRLRDRRQLPLHLAHDAEHVQRIAVPLLPGLEPDEDAPEVRLVGGGDGPVPADRRVRLDALGLRQDLLDFAQD